MNTEKLERLEKTDLSSGSHKSIDNGACIMEMVSYMADEPWSDHPKCACPILTEYAIRLNDRFSDEHRQRMKEFIPKLIGTRATDAIQIKRKQLIMWRNVTATYPVLLDLFKMTDLASELRGLTNCDADMKKAAVLLKDNKDKIYAYANAYANADAYAIRQKLADISLETLAMAIEVK